MSATLLYLHIDFDGKEVFGEASAGSYKDLIEIESFSWRVKATHREDTKSRKVNTSVTPDMLALEKFYDTASPRFAKRMRDGLPFKRATLHFAYRGVLDGSKLTEIMSIILEDGYVEDIKLNATDAGKAMAVKESVELSYKSLVLLYRPHVINSDSRGPACVFKTAQPTAR